MIYVLIPWYEIASRLNRLPQCFPCNAILPTMFQPVMTFNYVINLVGALEVVVSRSSDL